MSKYPVILVLAWSLPALAWGPEGHALVARLAEAQLTAAAQARVAEILGPDTTLASISSWPDQVRRSRPETAPWHYIDVPIDRPHVDMARDCPKGDCVIAKIEDFEKALADPATNPEQRREALMFIVHFVGDMHQPLHCSDNKDKGGNNVTTEFFGRPMNLHSVWDGGLLRRMGGEDKLFAEFSRDMTPRREKKWAKGTVQDWAEESHKAARKTVYGRLPPVAAGAPEPISDAYEHAADPLIRKQIEKAGIRLAHVLNTLLL
jgi:S1/P1 Nuclease